MNSIILYLLLILIAVISGKIIAAYTKDEWKQGKNWFLAVFILSIVMSSIFIIALSMAYTIIFMSLAIIALITWIEARKV